LYYQIMLRPNALVAVVVIAAAACTAARSTRRVPTPTLAQTIDAQIAEHEAVPWMLKRPLTWADFKGQPPASSPAAAQTAYSLFYGARCTGPKFEYRVVAAVRPKDSWVRMPLLRTPALNASALRHEQTHFDLTEIHARRMRRYYVELIAPCRTQSGELEDRADQFTRDEKAAQAAYDAETDHGRTAAQQSRWDKQVSDQLLALSKWAK
jgi:hypothetical protein